MTGAKFLLMDAAAYDVLPEKVKDVLATYDDNQDLYKEAERLVGELNLIGWTADYDLSGELFDVEPIAPQEAT